MNTDSIEDTRVVIIEDDADQRELLQELLAMDGYAVRTAGNGAEGLSAAAEHRPCCVLLDLGLPGLDGAEVARRLRDELGTELVILAITGHQDEAYREAAEAAGVDFVLSKPITADELRKFLPPLERGQAG